MGFLGTAWRSVKYLFRIQTGIGGQQAPLSAGHEAVAAVFLPLAGLTAGFASAVAVVLAQAVGLDNSLSVLAALAVLAALGGARHVNAMMGLSGRNEGFHGGVVLFAVLSMLFLFYGLSLLSNTRGVDMICSALLYLPATGSLAMVSAACVMPEPEKPLSLSSVKGLHMILSATLLLVLLLPRFGISSLAYVVSAVLVGSMAALVRGRKEYRVDLLYAAAAVAELAFLLLLLLANKPVIYY